MNKTMSMDLINHFLQSYGYLAVFVFVIPPVLFTGIALPYIADRRSGGKRSGQRGRAPRGGTAGPCACARGS
jgi:hypothetical protein